MKILSIGNSFSQDAHRYLHKLAKQEGVDLKTVNLYIGGCSLRTHYLNMLGDYANYIFEFKIKNVSCSYLEQLTFFLIKVLFTLFISF